MTGLCDTVLRDENPESSTPLSEDYTRAGTAFRLHTDASLTDALLGADEDDDDADDVENAELELGLGAGDVDAMTRILALQANKEDDRATHSKPRAFANMPYLSSERNRVTFALITERKSSLDTSESLDDHDVQSRFIPLHGIGATVG